MKSHKVSYGTSRWLPPAALHFAHQFICAYSDGVELCRNGQDHRRKWAVHSAAVAMATEYILVVLAGFRSETFCMPTGIGTSRTPQH